MGCECREETSERGLKRGALLRAHADSPLPFPLRLLFVVGLGRTGLASLAMISTLSLARDETHLVPLIFLDTLYHFSSTLDLAREASEKYLADLRVFKPAGADGKEKENAKEFEEEFGERLWEREEDVYDYLVKVGLSTRFVPASPLAFPS